MPENEMDIDAILKQALDSIRDFIRQDWNVVGELSNETGLTPDDIFELLYKDRVSIEYVVRVYSTIQKMLEDKTSEILAKIDSAEAEKILNSQLHDVKEYIRINPNEVGEIANKAGLPTDEILKIIYSDGKVSPRILQLYSVVQKMIRSKTEAILAKNPLSEESSVVLAQQHEDIKKAVKGDPNIAIELSQASGVPTDEIFRIVYINMLPSTAVIARLYNVTKNVQNSRNQGIEERNRML